MNKINETITKKIIQDIKDVIDGKKELLPWQKPWVGGIQPQNLLTGTVYKGGNVFLLNNIAEIKGYKTNFWVSGSFVKKKARLNMEEFKKPSWISFYEMKAFEDKETGDLRKIPFLRAWKVWNIDQFLKEGSTLGEIEIPEIESFEHDRIEEAEKIISEYVDSDRSHGLQLHFSGGAAYYRQSEHLVRVPTREYFKEETGFYSTVFHELVHSTGHPKILDRFKKSGFDSVKKDHSFEELVAEMGAAFLNNKVDIKAEYENSLSYLENWLTALNKNTDWLLKAGAKSQKAVELILGE